MVIFGIEFLLGAVCGVWIEECGMWDSANHKPPLRIPHSSHLTPLTTFRNPSQPYFFSPKINTFSQKLN